MSRTPLLSQPRVQRVLYPLAIGLLLIALWQWMVVAMELPPYLVPSPWLMLQTLVTDWAPLVDSRTQRLASEAAAAMTPRRTPPVVIAL